MSATRTAAVGAAADRLLEATRRGIPCAPVRDLIGPDDVTAAYSVQQRVGHSRVANGARIVGRKIGLTSSAVQAQLGVDRPDFGKLFDDMVLRHGDEVDMSRLLQPKVEAEIAFVLSHDIADPDASAASVRGAVAYASPALEIVDSRIASWDITFGDTVADNASSGLFVLGPARKTLDDFEPVEAEMAMTADGVQVSAGSGADCLGDPLNALAWLARTAVAVGDPLRAGEVVLSGALGPMMTVQPGMHVAAEISGLGTVVVRFGTGPKR